MRQFKNKRGAMRLLATASLLLAALLLLPGPPTCFAAGIDLPAVHFSLDDTKAPQQITGVMQIVFLMTILSIAPAILILMTSFTRFAIVLSFLRQALGTQQAPPNQVLVGLALFLTFFVMQPTWQRIHQEAIVPYQQQKISGDELVNRSMVPVKEFMLKHTRTADLALFVSMAQEEKPRNAEALSIATVIPAFVISELKTAFQIGFMLYIFYHPGYGRIEHPAFHGHDDAAAGHDLAAVQADAVHSR